MIIGLTVRLDLRTSVFSEGAKKISVNESKIKRELGKIFPDYEGSNKTLYQSSVVV